MAISSYFFNAVSDGQGGYDRVYNSEDVTSYLNKIVGNGVFPTPATQLQVSAGSGMQVIVGAGEGWINGHKIVNSAAYPIAIDAADALLNRIDSVIFYLDYTLREMGIEVKKGTAASNPTAPALVRTAQRYEMCLAQIGVAKQITSITAAMITDTRGNTNICGYVAGLIQQLDTTGLWQQWDAEFDDWFTTVKDTLSTSTLLRKYEGNYTTATANERTFNISNYVPQYSYALDILEVRINGLTLTTNEYSKSGTNITLATPIAEAGVPVSFAVYKSVDGSDAETVIEQVAELQQVVNTIEQGVYIASGDDDNQKLSAIVKAFLSGDDDYRQLELAIYGDLACTEPSTVVGDIAYWFDFAVSNSTRRVKLDFSHASRIVIDANNSDESTDVLIYADRIEIANLQAAINNIAAGNAIVGDATVEDSAFWLNGLAGQSGTIIGAEQGTFENCRISITAANGIAYGFSGNGNILRLDNCEIIAYNASSASAESVAVQVKGGETENVLIMDGCSCPIRARGGYKQSNVVKINSGFYCLTANILGKAAVKYSTGDGKTETGTMIVSK